MCCRRKKYRVTWASESIPTKSFCPGGTMTRNLPPPSHQYLIFKNSVNHSLLKGRPTSKVQKWSWTTNQSSSQTCQIYAVSTIPRPNSSRHTSSSWGTRRQRCAHIKTSWMRTCWIGRGLVLAGISSIRVVIKKRSRILITSRFIQRLTIRGLCLQCLRCRDRG